MIKEENKGWLHAFFDTIDIARNMSEVENDVIEGPSGGGALLYAVAMFVMAAVTGTLAYVFDLQSTWDGMNALTIFIIPQLPESQIQISQWLGLIFTIAPTFTQAFSAGLAKRKIPLVKWMVVGFTMFDVVTDIPRAMSWTLTLQAQFNQLGLFAWFAQTTFFVMWLFLSTIGFELLFVIFFWAGLLYTAKALGYEKATKLYNTMPKLSNNNKHSKQPSVNTTNIQDLLNKAKNNESER